MAKFGWSPGRLPDLQRKLATLPSAIRSEGDDATHVAAELGAEEMRDVIQNSGTGWEGRQGRVDTGSMLDSVVSEKNRFGWLKNYKEYFGMQDSGFVNLRKNSYYLQHFINISHCKRYVLLLLYKFVNIFS